MWRSERCGRPRRPGCGPPGRDERGYVTAEAAVALPVLVLFAAALLWGLMAAAAQIRCVDAARAGARAAARSEPQAAVLKAARDAAPRGAVVAVEHSGELVLVRVATRSVGPGPVGRALSVTLRAEAAALDESTVGGEAR